EGQRIQILNGKQTGNLGVTEIKSDLNEALQVTDLSRTLIDIAVRPSYSGGVFEVLNAYKKAKKRKVSIDILITYLKQLDYVYPYHQVIGFYMEKSGIYEASEIDLLKKIGMKYNFYLAYGIKKPQFVTEWKLYIPK